MELAEVKKRLENAICLLYTKDKYLLEVKINERSITHRLGLYLQDAFKDWDVDCEYNRYGDDPKRLPLGSSNRKDSVYPDIIVHKRGVQESNLLAIEAKKMGNNDKELDLKKLRRYRQELGYAYAVLLKVYTGENCRAPTICWICE